MRTKTNIFPTNLRQERGAEAPQVSNNVYNKRYTSEKVASRYKQSGRSMIEMLGVLAIIGVLTVGSITAYSKAMRRHLLNKQREQISTILATIETQYSALSASKSDFQTGDHTRVFKDLGWIPEEMIKDGSQYIYDVFKNRAFFWINAHSVDAQLGFYIYLNNGNAFEQCVNLYQTATSFHSSLKRIQIRNDEGYKTQGYTAQSWGDKFCASGTPH